MELSTSPSLNFQRVPPEHQTGRQLINPHAEWRRSQAWLPWLDAPRTVWGRARGSQRVRQPAAIKRIGAVCLSATTDGPPTDEQHKAKANLSRADRVTATVTDTVNPGGSSKQVDL